MSDFFNDFNAALPEFATNFGETWTLAGKGDWMAIEIEEVTAEMRAAPGGKYKNAATVLTVALEIVTQSGVKEGDLVMVRGQKLRVIGIDNDGDAARTVRCGSPNISIKP